MQIIQEQTIDHKSQDIKEEKHKNVPEIEQNKKISDENNKNTVNYIMNFKMNEIIATQQANMKKIAFNLPKYTLRITILDKNFDLDSTIILKNQVIEWSDLIVKRTEINIQNLLENPINSIDFQILV